MNTENIRKVLKEVDAAKKAHERAISKMDEAIKKATEKAQEAVDTTKAALEAAHAKLEAETVAFRNGTTTLIEDVAAPEAEEATA